MKKVLLRIWSILNSPVTDIVSGYGMILSAIFVCNYFSELSVPCVIAFCSGSLLAIGLDCSGHGYRRLFHCKSSAAADENN